MVPGLMGRGAVIRLLPGLALGLVFSSTGLGQDNYEIQVYGVETVPARQTMVELHSNYAFQGERNEINGVLPSNHAFHETLEVTHGFTPWFETGFYVFSSIQPGQGWQWVGDHIRPRVRAPEEWHLPVGVSLSTELGYQRPSFSEDAWTWELRPIFDKTWGRWYAALNPAFEKSLRGLNSKRRLRLRPQRKGQLRNHKTGSLGRGILQQPGVRRPLRCLARTAAPDLPHH